MIKNKSYMETKQLAGFYGNYVIAFFTTRDSTRNRFIKLDELENRDEDIDVKDIKDVFDHRLELFKQDINDKQLQIIVNELEEIKANNIQKILDDERGRSIKEISLEVTNCYHDWLMNYKHELGKL